METPVLTKKQQKKALSSKKAPLKSIRNIIAQPFEKYWPLVDDTDQELIINKLNKYLPEVKRNKIKINWRDRKSMTKEEFKSKKLMLAAEQVQPCKEILKSVIFGINAVTRSMEKNNPTCVLLSSKVDPQILTDHICTLASLKKIPLLVLNKLEETVMNTVGIKATTLAFKCDDKVDYFKDLCDNIINITRKFPVTDKHVTHKEPMFILNKECVNDLSHIQINEPKTIHFTRLSNKSRVFVPPRSQANKHVNLKDFTDFISVNNSESAKNKTDTNQDSKMEIDKIFECYIDTKPDIPIDREILNQYPSNKNLLKEERYIPLKVKRIQGNLNKIKKNKRNAKKQKKG